MEQTEQTEQKKTRGRPKMIPEERLTHDVKKYNRDFQRNAPKVKCEICDCEIKFYEVQKHKKTKKHTINQLQQENFQLKALNFQNLN